MIKFHDYKEDNDKMFIFTNPVDYVSKKGNFDLDHAIIRTYGNFKIGKILDRKIWKPVIVGPYNKEPRVIIIRNLKIKGGGTFLNATFPREKDMHDFLKKHAKISYETFKLLESFGICSKFKTNNEMQLIVKNKN